MSATSGTYSEIIDGGVLQDSSGTPIDGTELNTFTAEASLMGGGLQPILPAEFFGRTLGVGKVLHLTAMGILSTTGSPTFAWFLRLGTSSAGILLGQTTTLTAGATITNGVWILDAYLTCVGVGTAGTMETSGIVHGPTALATPFAGMIPHNNATFSIAFDTTIANAIWLGASCGTSNAANKIQLKKLLVRGLN